MDKLNLERRKDILHIALVIENQVSEVIAAYFQIDKNKTHTIGHKSTSLSFKNKIDLLNDLEIIDTIELKQLLLLMTFRNKFLHILECSSFVKAVELLGLSYATDLLKHCDLEDGSNYDLEFRYENAFKSLGIKCMDILLSKLKVRHQIMEEQSKVYIDLADYSAFVINSLFDLFDRTHDKFIPENTSDIKLNKDFAPQIEVVHFMYKELESLMESDSFKALRDQLSDTLVDFKPDKFYRVRQRI